MSQPVLDHQQENNLPGDLGHDDRDHNNQLIDAARVHAMPEARLISLQIFSQFFRARDCHPGHTVVTNHRLDRTAPIQVTCKVTVGIPIFDPVLLRSLQYRLTTLVISNPGHELSVNSVQFIIRLLVLAAGAIAHFHCRLSVGTWILPFLWFRRPA
jgi:hypothetical protein